MTVSELTPDIALKSLLEKKVKANTTVVSVYGHGELPNTGLGDDFISIQRNGVVRSMTKPMGVFRGNIALTIYCRSNTNGTAKASRTRLLAEQCEELVNCKSAEGFFFELNAANPITPVTVNVTSGYSTMVLNVEWRTPISE